MKLKNRYIGFLVLIFSMGCLPAQAESLDFFSLLGKDEAWKGEQEAFFARIAPYGFRYLDAQKSAASSVRRDRVSFLGFPVYDTRLFWKVKEGKSLLSRAEFSIYNKGDAKEQLSKSAFNALLNDLVKKLSGELGRGMLGRTGKPRPNYLVKQARWTARSPGVQLQWAYVEAHRAAGRMVPYGAEFVKVVMVPLTGTSAAERATQRAALTGEGMMVRAKTLMQLRRSVKRNAEGDVWVEGIPMVDQGQKGYCAAATSERVLRYFGLQVDQHQIAQIADTSAQGGTSLSGMANAITKVGRHYKLDCRELLPIEDGENFLKSDLMDQIKSYNSMAKKRHAEQIDWQKFIRNNSVDVRSIWAAMDPKILLESRMRARQAYNAFLRDIKRYTDQGIPVFWSCLVGMYPEIPALGQKGTYGHMRMIIGYNNQKKEIIYSDTWGARHAKKKMPADQAWAMTKGMIVLRPRM